MKNVLILSCLNFSIAIVLTTWIKFSNLLLKLTETFFLKTGTDQKTLQFFGRKLWNQIPETLKKINNLNTFKHNLKKTFLQPDILVFLFVIIDTIIKISNIFILLHIFIIYIIFLLVIAHWWLLLSPLI